MKTLMTLLFVGIAATSVAQLTPVDRTRKQVTPVLGTGELQKVPMAPLKDIEFGNWNFENGLTGWTVEGAAFNTQPTYGDNVATQRILYHMEYNNNNGLGGDYWKDQGYNPGYQGRYWIGTYENNPKGKNYLQTQGDGLVGSLTSSAFVITTSYCYFSIGGGADQQRLYVELEIQLPDGTWALADKRTSFRNSEIMYRERMDIAIHKNKLARIRIVDNASGGWGHINVDNFQFSESPLDGIALTDPSGRRYEVDITSPVWGFADTHAHPAHNLGFGKRLIVGKANAPLSETYSNDLCHQNHTTGGNGVLNTPFIGGADVHKYMKGWPDFIDFPKFDSKTHNQQNVEFLKRAWQGGLRLYCALAINNMYMPSLVLGPGNDGSPYDDESTTLTQIQEIKNMAMTQSSWMEIAYTPKDARRIILQGKLAIVLGVEADNFGNFKTDSYNWNDNVSPANAKLVALNESNAEALLENKLNQYFNLGIRQVTPIHYISGVFGGAAIFRAEISAIQFAFNNNITVVSGVSRKIPYRVKDDYTIKLILAGEDPVGFMSKISGADLLGNVNAMGMTSIGTRLMGKLMDKGFIIDSEHMGYDTKEMLFAIAGQRKYPIMSSHTDPASLNFNWTGQPVAFSGSPEFRMQNFGTTNIRNLASEFNLADEHYAKIRNSGGTVGVFMLPYYKKAYAGNVANDCAGSSKTFAHMYLYSADQMNGKGVALSSDRGMVDFIAPRFGPNSAFMLKDEELSSIKVDLRASQRQAQRNGVRYDRPMTSFHISWYHQPEDQGINEYENDAWAAMAAHEANLSIDLVPSSNYVLHLNRIKDYVKGLRAVNANELMRPGVFTGDSPFEQATMFCLLRNLTPDQVPYYSTLSDADKTNFGKIFWSIQPAWASMNAKYGTNQPLRRLKTGNRDWDFNTDGMAHYGLMPDFLQDLRNVGVTPQQLTFLFRSAEDYIQMWEKAASGTKSKNPLGNYR